MSIKSLNSKHPDFYLESSRSVSRQTLCPRGELLPLFQEGNDEECFINFCKCNEDCICHTDCGCNQDCGCHTDCHDHGSIIV